MTAEWRCKKFDALTPYELYAVIRLRNEVFVVEQACIFQDADNKDQQAYHMMCWNNDGLLACSRLLPAFVAYDEVSIGRVATAVHTRRSGLGRQLMERSVAACYSLFGQTTIRIGAQLYLRKFYESFHFVQSSPVYLEDGIEHMEMVLAAARG